MLPWWACVVFLNAHHKYHGFYSSHRQLSEEGEMCVSVWDVSDVLPQL